MVIDFVRKNFKTCELITMILLGVVILFGGIANLGSLNSDSAASNIGQLLTFFVSIILFGLLLYCMVSNRDQYTKFLAKVYLAYYTIDELLSIGDPFYLINASQSGLWIAAAVFRMLALFVFVALVVVGVIQAVKGKDLQKVFDILALAYLGINLIEHILTFVCMVVYDYGWASALDTITSFFVVVIVVVGYYLYQIKFVEKSTCKAESTEETVVEDKPVEDKPVKKTRKTTK